MAVKWNHFDKYEAIIDKYMLHRGEGETMASQAVTAVNKLVYKYYNDGDVFDNTHFIDGWCNDLSSYANWLHKYCEGAAPILEKITNIITLQEYEDLLAELCAQVLQKSFLKKLNTMPKQGSIYKCNGIFKFETQWYI